MVVKVARSLPYPLSCRKSRTESKPVAIPWSGENITFLVVTKAPRWLPRSFAMNDENEEESANDFVRRQEAQKNQSPFLRPSRRIDPMVLVKAFSSFPHFLTWTEPMNGVVQSPAAY